MVSRIFLAIVVLLSLIAQGSSQDLVIRNGNVVDVKNGEIIEQVTLIIENEKITRLIEKGDPGVSSDVPVLDASGKWLLPGLVDAHIHLFQSGGLYTRPDVIDLRKYRSYAEEKSWLKENTPQLLRRYVQNGVTTVIDVGGPLSNFKWRGKTKEKWWSPALYLTGPLISTYQPEVFRIKDPPIIKAASPGEARELVRKQLPYHPDFIKIWFIVRKGESVRQHLPVVKAVIDESHKHDLKVAVHATELETAREAVKQGADFLVHSVHDKVVDNEFLQLMKETGTYYIPTLQVRQNYWRVFRQELDFYSEDFALAEPFSMGTLFDLKTIAKEDKPEWLIKRLNDPGATSKADSIMKINLKKVAGGGIPVATGTDAGNIGTLHGVSYFKELQMMREAGLSNAAILKASTLNGAAILKETPKTGSIEKGKAADLLVLNKNPLETLDALREIYRIVHHGQLFNPGTLINESPAQVVQRQLNAYNARNLNAFLECFHENIKIYDYPGKLQYSGKEEMKKIYRKFFDKNPNVHCKVKDRMIMENTVIDKEKVTGINKYKILRAIAIYKVEKDIITKVLFVR